jgi:DNA polymerase III delta subunit
MITLIHGDNIEISRNELNRLKNSAHGEIRNLDGRNIDETNLTQALESSSLFGGEKTVIIENLFGKLGRKVKLIEKLAQIIKNSAANSEIILWEDKEVGKTVISSLGSGIKVAEFKIPVIIFKFLDALSPNHAKILLELFDELKKQDAPELIFSMIVRRFRQLIMLSDGEIPEGLQSWQTGRLTSQAKQFTLEKLMVMYKRLLDIEFSIKSGNSAFDMTRQIELFIIDL